MSKAKKQIEAALKRCQARVRKLQATKPKAKPKTKSSRPQAKKSKTKAPTRPRGSDNSKLWIWNWKEGGFNSARVATRREAIREAKRLGAPDKGGLFRGLTLDEGSLHEGTWDELSKLYKARPFD